MARIAKPYEVISEKKDKKPTTKISEAQEVILKYMQGLEPPKPVKWVRPIKEMFKPLAEQKDSSAARLAFTLNPMLRININKALSKKEGKYTDIVQMLKSKDEKDYVSGLDEIRTGVESGAHNVGASIGSLLFMGTDLAANTDFLSKFEEFMKTTKPDQPETWRGELISLMTSFAVPGS